MQLWLLARGQYLDILGGVCVRVVIQCAIECLGKKNLGGEIPTCVMLVAVPTQLTHFKGKSITLASLGGPDK